MVRDSSVETGRGTTDVRRIQLGNTVFEGKNDVYLLEDDGLALIDVGVSIPETRTDLEQGLDGMGYNLEDIDDIVLTHWHADHAGLAGAVQAESDATVWVHTADAPLVAGESSAWDDYHARENDRFEAWRLPPEPKTQLRTYLDDYAHVRGEAVDVTTFADGDRLTVGGVDLDVVHLPGHAAGLCAFAFETDDGAREAFVGDAILPKYTPNVGGADLRVEAPLQQYLTSLDRIVDADWARAWPGHRDPIDDPTARAETIRGHHVERTRRVVDVLASEGPCDVWTVSAHLFGDLKGIHILHGPGEAWAHLDHLERDGVVSHTDGEYHLVDDDVDVEALFDR